MTYTYALGLHTSGPEWAFEPRDPSLNFYLSGQPHDFTFTIDGTSQAGLNVTELADDIWVWRNGELIFRGPVINIDDTGDANEHTLAITANSYRYRLQRLYTNLTDVGGTGGYSIGTFNGPNAAWDLISKHLGANSGANGTDLFDLLVKGTIFSPVASTFAASAPTGTDIASTVDALAQVQPFDWDLIPNDTTGKIEFTAWQPGRGSLRNDQAFVYIRGNPGTNCTFQRTMDISQYSNRVYVNGQNTSGTQITATAASSSGWAPAGRYTAIEDGSDLDSSQFQARANTLLKQYQTPAPAYTITPNEGVWTGPDTLWLGDQPTLMIRSGRLADAFTTLSINQITLAPAEGNDNFSFTAGAQPAGQYGEKTLSRGLRDMTNRIRVLELTRQLRGA